jgi:hypothetical protein
VIGPDDRARLIARKEEVRRELERARRALEAARQRNPPAPRRTAALEAQVERLMAEEFNLRLAIDRSR